jgi:hypothetical protein
MWQQSYSAIAQGLKAEQVWKVWADVNQWHTWQDDIEYANLKGDFSRGNVLRFKPKGGPKFDLELIKSSRMLCS